MGGPANVRDELRRASVSSRADGSIALLGSLSTTPLGRLFRAPWCHGNDGTAGLLLVLPNCQGDAVSVKAVGATDTFSERVDFVDD